MDAKTERKIASLTKRAIAAHRSYRIAKAANLKPIQSPRETKAYDRYQAIHVELDSLCRANNVGVPKTWNI